MDDRRSPFPPPAAALTLLLAVLIARPALSLLYGALMPGGPSKGAYYLLSAAQEIVLFALPAHWALERRYPAARESVRRCPLRLREAVSFALAAMLGVFVLSYAANLWMFLLGRLGVPIPTAPRVPVPDGPADLILALLAIAVLPALCEELFFRGLVFSAFEPQGTRRAALVSALLFALMHGELMALPVHLTLGFLFAFLMVKTRSLFAPMVYHAFHNGALLFISFLLAKDGAAQEAAPLSLAELLSSLPVMALLGGIAWLLIAMALRARDPNAPDAAYTLPDSGARLSGPEKALLSVLFLWLALSYLLHTWGGLFL